MLNLFVIVAICISYLIFFYNKIPKSASTASELAVRKLTPTRSFSFTSSFWRQHSSQGETRKGRRSCIRDPPIKSLETARGKRGESRNDHMVPVCGFAPSPSSLRGARCANAISPLIVRSREVSTCPLNVKPDRSGTPVLWSDGGENALNKTRSK